MLKTETQYVIRRISTGELLTGPKGSYYKSAKLARARIPENVTGWRKQTVNGRVDHTLPLLPPDGDPQDYELLTIETTFVVKKVKPQLKKLITEIRERFESHDAERKEEAKHQIANERANLIDAQNKVAFLTGGPINVYRGATVTAYGTWKGNTVTLNAKIAEINGNTVVFRSRKGEYTFDGVKRTVTAKNPKTARQGIVYHIRRIERRYSWY